MFVSVFGLADVSAGCASFCVLLQVWIEQGHAMRALPLHCMLSE